MVLISRSRLRLATVGTAWLTLAGILSACSSGDSDNGQATPPVFRDWVPGQFFSSVAYRNLCENPRTGNDPFSGQPVRDRQGRAKDENNWLRSIHNELYLWYSEIADINDPANFTTPAFFDLQITNLPSDTMSGRPKDNFHFAVNTQAFFDSLVAGINAGYGAAFRVVNATPPREVVVAFTEPGSTAANNNLARGARIISIDGEPVVDGDPAVLNAGLSPATLGESHTFVVRDLNTMVDRNFTMTSEEVTQTPVQHVNVIAGPSTNIGYLLFNDHIATAEAQLIDAFTMFSDMAVTDIILDLRYNGGGLLDLASELAYMIGGDATDNLTFERLQFNDQYDNLNVNPVTGENLSTPFHSTAQGFSDSINPGDSLPTVNGQNVVIITSDETCSASESIINGLRGTSVKVFQVGSTTCGKPYGSLPFGNCGTTYLFTQFEGFNELDEGEYSDGFEPENVAVFGVSVPGCGVADDFDHLLTETAEANISVALDILADPTNFNAATTCPAPPPVSTKPSTANKPTGVATAVDQLQLPNKRALKVVF